MLLKCYQKNGVDVTKVNAPIVLQANGPFTLTLAEAKIVSDPANSVCPGQ